jgi:hypothetical protein
MKETWASTTPTWQCILPNQETDFIGKQIKATKAKFVDWKLNLNHLDLLISTFDKSAIGQKHHSFFHDLPVFYDTIRRRRAKGIRDDEPSLYMGIENVSRWKGCKAICVASASPEQLLARILLDRQFGK